MHWNNRIVKDKHGYHTLREVFYNEKNEIMGFTVEPMYPRGDDLEEFLKSLQQIVRDVERSKGDVLDEESIKCVGFGDETEEELEQLLKEEEEDENEDQSGELPA